MEIQQKNEALSPSKLYSYLADVIKPFLGATKLDQSFASLACAVTDEPGRSFRLTSAFGTADELAAYRVICKKLQNTPIAQVNKAVPLLCDTAYVVLGLKDGSNLPRTTFIRDTKLDHDYVSIVISTADAATFSGEEMASTEAKKWKTYIYYGDGLLYCCNERSKDKKVWPCTMADLFEARGAAQRFIVYHIMQFFGQCNRLWLDLAADFLERSAYSAIPVDEIWNAHSRAELLQSHYGKSMKRNNRENIGKGIFLARAASVVAENELQKLHGFDPGHRYLGKKKADLIAPLAEYIYQHCPNVTAPVKLPRGHTATVDKAMIRDALCLCIELRRKCPITFHSAAGIYEWHQEASRVYERRDLPLVSIPKDSRFKKLKLPPDCIRLKTRSQFVEEGNFQDNCVASYIDNVNDDISSIWSMRKENGERYTIEICIRRSKNMPNGYFYIEQMFGWGNSDCPAEERARVRDAISSQRPYVAPTQKRNQCD